MTLRTQPPQAQRNAMIGAVQLAAATVDGVAISTVVLHATRHLGLLPAAMGAVLTAAGVAALTTAVPLGALADRLGLRTSAAIYALGSAVALAGYAVADSMVGYVVAAVCFSVAQAAAGSVRQALAVHGASPATRLGIRATMHTLLNVGFGLGTVLGSVVAAVGSDTAFRAVYGIAAAIATLTAAATMTLPRTTTPASPTIKHGVLNALRDRRFATATLLAAVIQLTMPVLSVLLPVWVLTNTEAPVWVPGAALAINTAMVIGIQRPWSARVITASIAARSAQVAAMSVLLSCGLMAIPATDFDVATASGLIVAAVILLTVGEIAGGAATWYVALQNVPAEAEGRYQSAFSMSSCAARILGPAVALPMIMSFESGGWIALGIAMATACLGIAALTSWNEIDTHDDTVRPQPAVAGAT